MQNLQRTPLFDFHKKMDAKIVPFAGWEMPVQYTSIIEEHLAVRNAAGLFDVSHMGEVSVTGPDAEKFLNYLVTNDVAKLPIGKALYTVMCYNNGGVVDDLIIYRLEDDNFFICINAGCSEKDVEWFFKHSTNFDCEVKNLSDNYAQIAIQGPKAIPIVSTVLEKEVEQIKKFQIREINIENKSAYISRTGYTGEDGFEIYCDPDIVESLSEKILESGKEDGIKLCGLAARDSLRLEAGFTLYGHEISESISPLQAGLGWVVKLNKESAFIGQDALLQEKEQGIKRKIFYYILNDKRIARQDTDILQEGEVVGKVVSGTFSPVIKKPIGSALVKTEGVNMSKLYVELRKNQIFLEPTKPPLHKLI